MRLFKHLPPVTTATFRHPLRRRSFCNYSSNPFLSKLLQTPTSQFNHTLDSSPHSSSLKTSQSSLNALVTALTSSSPDKARLVLEWRLDSMLKDNEIGHHHYSNLISLCANIHNVSLALRIFTCMENIGVKPTSDVFNSLIRVCLSSPRDVITALSLFEIMQNSRTYRPNSQTYDSFVFGFSNLGDVAKAQSWLTAKKAAGFLLNLHNYESIVSVCVRKKDFDTAERYYGEMMSVGVIPSVMILEYMLEVLCKRRNVGGVKEFLKFLVECRFEISGNMIAKVVKLYSDLGKLDGIEELLDSVSEFDLKGEALVQLHCEIIRLYAKLDRLDDVEYSVGRMMSRGMCFRSADDIEKVICSYFRKEAYDRLDLFLNHVKGRQKLRRSTYDLLVAGYKRVGLEEKLDSVIQDMKLAGVL
ncbi:hypothetical protein M5689_011422 [Euphorbia peplus]|nr:hypothetical protein M5689_011422 [Euphorbia peplus]